MKRIFSVLTLSAIAFAGMAQQGPRPYNIIGTSQASENGDSIFLVKVVGQNFQTEQVTVVSDGHFKLQGSTDAIDMRSVLAIKNGIPKSVASVIVSPNAQITVDLGRDLNSDATVTGDKNNDIVQKVQKYEQEQTQRHMEYIAAYQDTTMDIVTRFYCKQKIDSLSIAFNNNRAQTIVDNMPQPICPFLFRQWGSQFNEQQFALVMDAMGKKMPNDPLYKSIMASQKAEAEAEAATAVGRQFLEIALVDLNGNMKRLSDVVKANKYTLVDFWASWCRPCLAELPNVKKVYDEYHDKGLEIYGVSLDENPINWQSAISRMGMNWIHVSDLKGWQSAGAKTYNIKGIPATVLIDHNGKIVAKNLRGEELANMMAKLLK